MQIKPQISNFWTEAYWLAKNEVNYSWMNYYWNEINAIEYLQDRNVLKCILLAQR